MRINVSGVNIPITDDKRAYAEYRFFTSIAPHDMSIRAVDVVIRRDSAANRSFLCAVVVDLGSSGRIKTQARAVHPTRGHRSSRRSGRLADPSPCRAGFQSESSGFQFVRLPRRKLPRARGFRLVSQRLTCRTRGALIALMQCVQRVFTASPMASSNLRVDRILCAVTFSPSSRCVVAWAAALARRYKAEVRLFHSMPIRKERAAAERGADSEQVLKRLFTLGHGLRGRPRISAAVTEGDAAAEILRHARMMHADVIAIGMHARDESVSPLIAQIANNAPCPVLVVDDTAPTSPLSGILNHVVVAINFLPASLVAASYAFAVAAAVNARVTAVHVLPEQWEGPRRADANVDETRQRAQHHFRQLLHDAVSDISGSRGNWTSIVTSGRPCAELVRVAAAGNADLIVMGIDAAQKSQNEFGETTSCMMQLVRRTVLLVPERMFREPKVSRRGRSS